MNRLRAAALAALLSLALAPAALTQETVQQERPAADPADVSSIDAIITALYAAISGPAGQDRDWDRLRSLFLPEARMIPTGTTPQGEHRHLAWTVDEYIEQVGPNLVRVGFTESEIARRTERYSGIAHVWSTYSGASEAQPDDDVRGINSIQLMNDGQRWWVVTIFWEGETDSSQIPASYLP